MNPVLTFPPDAMVKNSLARGCVWGVFIPQGFKKPTDAATPRLISAGKFLRFARTPEPPRPVPPPGLGFTARLKLYLKYVLDGPWFLRMVKRSAAVTASSSFSISVLLYAGLVSLTDDRTWRGMGPAKLRLARNSIFMRMKVDSILI